jgi:hypothetical protein
MVQDGAGRIGRMVFARHGKKFDCHLKQVGFLHIFLRSVIGLKK